MSSSANQKLLAVFPGLVDICETEQGTLAYLVCKDGEFSLVESIETDTGATAYPPDRQHFPFLLPRASEVLKYIPQDDKTLYDDVLTYLQRFSALDDQQWSVV